MLRRRLRKESLLFWLVCGALLAAGELLVRAQVLSPAVYAAPSEIALAGVRCLSSQLFLRDVLATTGRVMLGVMLGFPVGILLAFGLSSLGQARSSGEMLLGQRFLCAPGFDHHGLGFYQAERGAFRRPRASLQIARLEVAAAGHRAAISARHHHRVATGYLFISSPGGRGRDVYRVARWDWKIHQRYDLWRRPGGAIRGHRLHGFTGLHTKRAVRVAA
jgi:hypothetical protein